MAFPILIDTKRLHARIDELAREVQERYEDPLLVAVLEGARPFARAICERIGRAPDAYESMRLRSYEGTESSGSIRILQDLEASVAGRDVLILEDIVDTGRTIDFLRRELHERGARCADVYTLLSKPSRRIVEVPLQGVGFEIPDEFVIGFGMDLDERYRTLPYVAIWSEEAERRAAGA